MDRDPRTLDFPSSCNRPADRTQGVFLSNQSADTITDVAFAYLDHDEVFWSAPLGVAASLKGGKEKWLSLDRKKIKTIEFIIKYSSQGTVYREARAPIVQGKLHFYRCIGLAVYASGIQLVWFNSQEI